MSSIPFILDNVGDNIIKVLDYIKFKFNQDMTNHNILYNTVIDSP